MTKKQFAVVLVLSFAWIFFIHVFGSRHHTFKTKWQDNVSNISSTLLFTVEGFNIYRQPVGTLTHPYPLEKLEERFKGDVDSTQWFWHEKLGVDKPLFFVWPDIARPYPPGAWVWYAPYSALLYSAGFSLSTVTFLSSLVFLIIAHICFFLFFNELKPVLALDKGKFYKASVWFFFFVLYTELIRWSGMGQYDLIAMIPLFYFYKNFKKQNYVLGLFLFGVALFFHFRSLFSLGLAVYAGLLILFNWKKHFSEKKAIKNYSITAVTLSLGGVAALVFYYNSKYLTSTDLFKLNDFHYSLINQKKWYEILLFALLFIGPPLWFLKNKLWGFFSVTASTLLILFTSPQMRGWYLMFVFPIFLLLDKNLPKRKAAFYACLIFYLFTVSTFINQNPLELTFFKDLLEIIRGDNVS